jgi:carboxypeptidase family protein
MKTALLFVLLSLFTLDTQAQRRPVSAASRRIVSVRVRPSPRALNPQAAIRNPKSEMRNSLPIRRVILYSNGVAHVERRGLVSNHAEVSLSFKQSQVDDVLKSMVVLDLGKGRIGAVSYNSSTPPSSRMAEIPFSISAATDGNNGGGLAGVLSQLQGARVIVRTATRTVTGSVLTVEGHNSQIDSGKPPVTTHRLVIASDKGELTAFDLAEVRSVQLADEGSRRDLTEFAHAAASARRRDAKTIVVTSDGSGEREMVVSYTIAAPIWKTTYRVLLDSTGQPFFQGWAIVDNVGDEDWNGIELSLVSGTPVSFIQPIQNPVYRYRPVIPLRDDLNLKPQTYEPGEVGSGTGSLTGRITDPNGASVPNATITLTNNATNQSFDVTTDSAGIYRADSLPPGTYSLNASAPGFKNLVAQNLNVRPGLRSRFNANLDIGGVSETVTVTASDDNPVTRNVAGLYAVTPGASAGRTRESLSNLVSRRESGVEARTTASEVGDLFEYRIDQPVTVPRDRSALIPILQTRMEGERVSIFNEESPAPRPMSGMLLKNISPLTLEDGSLTVIDGDAYAGEALLERLKPGEERLISFAVDLGTLVNVREEDEDRQPVFLVRAVNGVVEAHYYDIRKKVYTLVNQTDRPRIVYLEHPRDEDEDWELTAATADALDTEDTEDTADSAATADSANTDRVIKTAHSYRFRVKLAPHQKVEFPVVERNEQWESYQLSTFTRRELELFIARKYVDNKTKAALEAIISLKDKVVGAEARLQQINKEAAEIAEDQQRLRENIRALTDTAEAKQLIARYVSRAGEQETRLEQIEKERRAVTDERARLQEELNTAIRGLSLDRKLK